MSIITCKGRNKSYPHPHPCNTYTFRNFSTDKSKAAATVTESEASNSALASDSTETEETPIISEPRKFPTRHSRHHPPAIAPATVLKVETDNILNSRVGSLFGYDSSTQTLKSKLNEYEEAHALAHPIQEKVLYLMRGYANLIDGSIVQTNKSSYQVPGVISVGSVEPTPTPSLDISPMEIVETMMKLVNRMEKEGEVYVQLRSKFRLQLAQTRSLPAVLGDLIDDVDIKNDSDEAETEDEEQEKNAWRFDKLVSSFGSPPGPTTSMYDLVLDAHACLLSQSSEHNETTIISLLQSSYDLLEQLEHRHELDESQGYRYTSNQPTQCTYNSVLRGCASLSPSVAAASDEARDLALVHATRIFDTMVKTTGGVVVRNSATYAYYLQAIRNLLPKSPAAGNIAHGVWFQAMNHDCVIDVNVVNALLQYEEGYSEDFDEWLADVRNRYDESLNGFGFPVKWSRNKKARRFDKRFNCY